VIWSVHFSDPRYTCRITQAFGQMFSSSHFTAVSQSLEEAGMS
jgi:hypothetical protein